MLRLVSVRERDVREVNMERRFGREQRVRPLEHLREHPQFDEPAVARRVHMGEVEDGADPATAPGDLEHVVDRPELADPPHHLHAERDGAFLSLEPRAELAKLLADGIESLVAFAPEQETGVKDDDLGAGCLRDSGRMVEHSDRHVQLAPTLGVSHESGDRRVDGQHDLVLARECAEALSPVVIHPELALEVDFAGRVAALEQEVDRGFGALAGRHARRPEADPSHGRHGIPSNTVSLAPKEARECRPVPLLP